MYTLQIKMDDDIYENIIGLLKLLPQERVEITQTAHAPGISLQENHKAIENISEIESKITELLKTENLLHFKFYKNPNRLLYAHTNGTPNHISDFQRLVRVLKNNNIAYENIGTDVIMIEE